MSRAGDGAAPPPTGAGSTHWHYVSALSLAPLRPSGGGWLVTFTDLVALLLTFFVLMFSMTKIDEARWRGLVRSLSFALDAVVQEDVSRPAVDYQIPTAVPDLGTSLAYLAPVVLEQLAAEPALSSAVIRRLPDRLIISLPAHAVFAPASARVSPAGEATLFAIGGIVRNIDNVLTVEASGGAGSAAGPDWRDALARAAAVADNLRQSGYRGAIAAVARGTENHAAPGDGADPRAAPIARIDLVIHERARDD